MLVSPNKSTNVPPGPSLKGGKSRRMKHSKKHQNRTINDFGFTTKQVEKDFAFVYKEYFS